MRLVTPLEMMKLEDLTNQSGVSYDSMMDQAGSGLAVHIARAALEQGKNSIVFLCGNGNNAGDCFVAAAKLAKQFNVTVCMTAGIPKTRTAYTKYRQLKNIPIINAQDTIREAVRNASVIVDGVFGIGFRGELPPFIRELSGIIAEAPDKLCIAVDIPSGGSGLSGTVAEGTLHCKMTVTFGAAKTGMFIPPLSEYCGAVYLVEIGIPADAFEQLSYPVMHLADADIRALLPARPMNAHKGMFGTLLTVAGCRNMPGAAMLAVQAALRTGVGLSCLASEEGVCRMLVSQSPESIMLPLPTDNAGKLTAQAVPSILENAKTASAVLIGCGLGLTDGTRKLVTELLTQLTCPVILDADGLNAVAPNIDILRKAKAPVILTPHPGEMSRLMRCSVSDIQKDRITAAKKLAARFPNTVVVLKGSGTVIATAEHASVNTTGNSGMSKGGSGDVLAGIIAGLAAQHIPPEDAAKIGVYLHGLAGDCAAAEFSRRAMLPSDIIRQLPLLFGEYE